MQGPSPLFVHSMRSHSPHASGKFPNLFLISNLLVIPAAAAILYLSFSLFVLSFWKPAVLFFGFQLDRLIFSLNWVVVQIEQIPYSVLSGIDISTLESLMIYAIIIAILVFIVQEERFGLYAALGFTAVLAAFQIVETWQQQRQHFITIYNVKGETAIALVSGTQVTFLARKELWESEQKMLFHVRHHWWNKGISEEHFLELNDSTLNRRLEWGGRSFAVLNLNNEKLKDHKIFLSDSLDFAVVGKVYLLKQEIVYLLPTKNLIVDSMRGFKMADNPLQTQFCKPFWHFNSMSQIILHRNK
jgi:hypothetical protein